jgi:hypothetical protein
MSFTASDDTTLFAFCDGWETGKKSGWITKGHDDVDIINNLMKEV